MHLITRPAMRQSLTGMKRGHRLRPRTMQSTDLGRQDWLLRWRHLHQVLPEIDCAARKHNFHESSWLFEPRLLCYVMCIEPQLAHAIHVDMPRAVVERAAAGLRWPLCTQAC